VAGKELGVAELKADGGLPTRRACSALDGIHRIYKSLKFNHPFFLRKKQTLRV
jgi:hypothetical protein